MTPKSPCPACRAPKLLRRRALCCLLPMLLIPALSASAQDAVPDPAEAPPAEILSLPLLDNGGFETLQAGNEGYPADWTADPAASRSWGVDATHQVAGAQALRVDPGQDRLTIVTAPLDVEPGLTGVSGLVMVQGPEGTEACLRWWRTPAEALAFAAGAPHAAPLRVDCSTASGGEGWQRLTLEEQAPPEGAAALQLVLMSPPADLPIYWDQAQLTARVERRPELKLLLNQVGYEVTAPKSFMVSANFDAAEGRFRIKDILDNELYAGALTGGSAITGGDGREWRNTYWRGDFSSVDTPGAYVLEVELGAQKAVSVPFEVGVDLLWHKTFALALSTFGAHRCGVAVPGFHEACHLDDASGPHALIGGWHDGSHYGKQNNAFLLWKLAEAQAITLWRTEGEQSNPLAEEVAWGTELLLRAMPDQQALPLPVSAPDYWGPPHTETDNAPATGDERALQALPVALPLVYAAALARVHEEWSEAQRLAVEQGVEWSKAHAPQQPLHFAALFNLWKHTEDDAYLPRLKALAPAPEVGVTEELTSYAANSEDMLIVQLVLELQTEADAIVARAGNLFGVFPYEHAGKTSYFETVESSAGTGAGNTGHILAAAEKVAMIYRLVPKPEYLQFIYNQLNWLFGVNPFGISLMAGAGEKNLPSYCHPYATAGVAGGIVPGALANGIAARGAGDDRPFLDLSGAERPLEGTNGVSLVNSALYLNTLAHLKRTPLEVQEGAPNAE